MNNYILKYVHTSRNLHRKSRYRNFFLGLLIITMFTSEMIITAANNWGRSLDIVCIVWMLSQMIFVIIYIRYIKQKNQALVMFYTYVAWFIVSRPLCGDNILFLFSATQGKSILSLQLIHICIMVYGFNLEPNIRKIVFSWLSILFCVFYFVISFFSLYVAVTHKPITLPFYLDIGITGNYVHVLSRNRNTVAQWECIAFCLALCQFAFIKHRNKYWLLLLAFVEAVYYAAVAVSCSRTSMISTAVILSMALALLTVNNIRKQKTRIAVAVAVILLTLPITYKGFDLTCNIINHLTENVMSTSSDTNVSAPLADTVKNESSESYISKVQDETLAFGGKRDAKSIRNLSGRMNIWYASAALLKAEPDRLLFGSLDFMDKINSSLIWQGIDETMSTTHNCLIEVLMRTGILGFVLFFAFLVILAVRMIKIFFFVNADLSVKLLTLPLIATLIKNMCESAIVTHDDITNYVFFFVAGIFLAYYDETFITK